MHSKALLTSFLILSLLGVALGQLEGETFRFVYHAQQGVNGAGFFNTYQKIDNSRNRLSDIAHGSGNYTSESKAYSQKEAFVGTWPFWETEEHILTFAERSDYAYAPKDFYFGKYFKTGPFNSLGKETTCTRNAESVGNGTAMNALFDYAQALNKDLDVDLYWYSFYSDDVLNETVDRLDYQHSWSELDLDANFIGKAHFGVMEFGKKDNSSNFNEKTLVDEDYWGRFNLSKNMAYERTTDMLSNSDDWLPCCSGGYLTMPTYYQWGPKGFGSKVKGVFDCTCFTVPKSAEWPTVQ